jgi:hypothetical protein
LARASGDGGSQEAQLLGLGLWCADKQIRLSIGSLYATAGDVEVTGLDLNADELAAELGAGNTCGPAAGEGIKDDAARANPIPDDELHRIFLARARVL